VADPGRLAYGRAEYLVPLGGTGAQIGAYYSNTVYAVGGNDSLAAVGLNGKAQVVGLYATHPLMKRLDTSINLKFGGESISLQDKLLGGTSDKDEIRKLIAGISYDSTDRFLGRNFISFGYARGLGGFLGGTENGAIGTSYTGADDTFDKFSLDAMRVQKLPGYNHLIARGNVQYSPDRLFSAERMQVGGEGSVRGVTPATISGDSGYFTSLELVVSPFFPEALIFNQKIGDTIQFALFTDCGWATNTSPRPSEITSSSVSSVGAGLRLYGDNRYIFKLDWALPSTHGSYKSINVNESQVYVQAAVSF
jgi:hemolysin activation/secretion protein